MSKPPQLHEKSKSDSFLRAELGGLLPDNVLEMQPDDLLPQGVSWLAALRALIFYVLSPLASRAVVGMAHVAGLFTISHTTLLAMLPKLEPHLHQALLDTVSSSQAMAMDKAVRARGFVLMALDATRVTSRHRNKPQSHAVHVLWELTTQLVCQVRVPAYPLSGETLSWVDLKAGLFLLADRAYCYRSAFTQAAEAGAALCARYRLGGCTLFRDEELTEEFDPIAFTSTQQDNSSHLLRLWVKTPTGALDVWVSIMHMGEEWGDEQRRRAVKNKQDISKASEALMEYLIVVAYLPSAAYELGTSLSRLYRSRWGIEIEFRRMKSGRRLSELEFKSQEKLRAAVCAHLLGQVLVGMASCENLKPERSVSQMAHEYEVRQIGVLTLLSSLIPMTFSRFRELADKIRQLLSCSERCKDEPRTLDWLDQYDIFDSAA